MPYFTVIAEILQTRSYSVFAADIVEADEAVRSEFSMMEYDVLEETVDTTEVQPED